MTKLLSLNEAAARLSTPSYYLLHIIDAGDVVPSQVEPGGAQKSIWHEDAVFGFSAEDIVKFEAELERRKFKTLRAKFQDVLGDEAGFAFGPGWTAIVEDFLSHARENFGDLGFKLVGGKEKFGGIQLSLIYDRNSAGDRVSVATARLKGQALATCEECGEPGRLRLGVSICKTTCDRHARLVHPLRPEDGKFLSIKEWVEASRKENGGTGRISHHPKKD